MKNNGICDYKAFEKVRVYLGVRTCEVYLCFVTIMFVLSIVLTSLFSLFYVTREGDRFLHRGLAESQSIRIQAENKQQRYVRLQIARDNTAHRTEVKRNDERQNRLQLLQQNAVMYRERTRGYNIYKIKIIATVIFPTGGEMRNSLYTNNNQYCLAPATRNEATSILGKRWKIRPVLKQSKNLSSVDCL